NLFGNRIANSDLFDLFSLAATSNRAGDSIATGEFPFRRGFRAAAMQLQRRSSPLTPQMICQLVGTNRKQVTFQPFRSVVVRQADQKANEGLLNDIFTRRTVANPALRVRQQATFVAINQRLPRL